MRRRHSNPIIVVAAFLALAIGAWWQRDDAPVHTDARTATSQAATPAATPAVERTQSTAATAPPLTAPDPSGLERIIPNDTERRELEKTLALIARGGPFPHRQDGAVFMNREGRLPDRPRGYYHEYTVRTPKAKNRGARRVVRGDGGEVYYTRDHYRTFIRIDR